MVIMKNIKGYCKSATIEEIQKHKHVLTPGRYVGIPDEEDDGIPFEDKMADLSATSKRADGKGGAAKSRNKRPTF